MRVLDDVLKKFRILILLDLVFIGMSAGDLFALNLGDKLPVVAIAALKKGSVDKGSVDKGSVDKGSVDKGYGRSDVSSADFDTSQTLGKVTMLNFWATWCDACKVELLEMEKSLKVLKSEKDLRLVFVNLDKDPNQGIAWAKQNLVDPVWFLTKNVMDPQFAVTEKLGVDAFPMTLVINRQGSLSYIQRGYTPGQGLTEKLVSLLRKELQAPLGTH